MTFTIPVDRARLTEREACTVKNCCWLLCVATAACVSANSWASEKTNKVSPEANVPGTTSNMHRLSGYAESAAHVIASGQVLLPWHTATNGQVPPQFPLLAADPDRLPTRLIHIRISRDLLDEQLHREIKRTDEFVDEVLEADVRGTATTVGSTRVVLEPRENAASLVVIFRGTVTSRSRGYAGPVVIDSDSQTQFKASRRLIVSADGLQLERGPCEAQTSTTTNGVKVRHLGVGRRIVERVARRRVDESRLEADEIISVHTLNRINSVFDHEIMKVSGPLDQALRGNQLKWTIDGAEHVLRFGSTPDYMDVAVQRMSAASGELSVEPPIDGQSRLAVRAHRAFVRRLLNGGEMARLQPMLAGFMVGPVDQQALGATRSQGYAFHWSPDRDWLVLDYCQERHSPEAEPTEQPAAADVAATKGQ